LELPAESGLEVLRMRLSNVLETLQQLENGQKVALLGGVCNHLLKWPVNLSSLLSPNSFLVLFLKYTCIDLIYVV